MSQLCAVATWQFPCVGGTNLLLQLMSNIQILIKASVPTAENGFCNEQTQSVSVHSLRTFLFFTHVRNKTHYTKAKPHQNLMRLFYLKKYLDYSFTSVVTAGAGFVQGVISNLRGVR